MDIAHIHPMIVHFPIVLVFVALGLDLWALRAAGAGQGGTFGINAGAVMTAGAAAMAIVAYVFGTLAYDVAIDNGFDEAVLEGHEGWGTTTMIVLIVMALVRIVMWRRGMSASRIGTRLALAMSAAAVVLVVVTAGFGGHLVYDLGVNVQHPA